MEGQKINLNDFVVNVFCKAGDFMKSYFPARNIRIEGFKKKQDG
jgi:hypothetical protein